MKGGLEPAAQSINYMFKKEFCRQFFKARKRWPNVELDTGVNSHIRSCIHANEWGETASFKWDPQDFLHVKLTKNFEFNYHVDTIDIIADKSIIPRLSERISYEFDNKAFRTLYSRFPTGLPPTTKSVCERTSWRHLTVRRFSD